MSHTLTKRDASGADSAPNRSHISSSAMLSGFQRIHFIFAHTEPERKTSEGQTDYDSITRNRFNNSGLYEQVNMGDPSQVRQQPAPQAPARNKSRGARSLCIDRWENSFGFRLRHFIVYPPESYKLLARDQRFGLSQGSSSSLDEAMDTMFVMAVQKGSPAEAAGLVVGDRIVSINGSTVAGKTYAEVVQQIQKTPDRLNLLVVPGEEDIIQQYYRDTAHNPKTNVRPRLKSPEVTSEQRRAMAASMPPKTTISPKIARTTIMQQQQQQLHPVNVLPTGVPYTDTEPIYNQLTWSDQKIVSGSESRGTIERLHLKTQLSRRSSDGSNKQPQAEQISVIKPTSPNPSAFYPNSSGCRLSLDGGMLDRRGSSSSSTLTDDSVIMSRIRKSCEQKEEFLKNTIKPSYPPIIAREFYARPQKLQKPVWPPQSPEPEGTDSANNKTSLNDERQFSRALTRIQESLAQSYDSSSLETDLDEVTKSPDSSISRSQSEESESVRRCVTQPNLHIVSRRAKQFETGQLEEENRTNFYRSELSRLSAKRNVPNVAVRKQEFEQRVGREERKPTARDERSQEASPSKCGSSLSGNRTVIVGSKTLHAEPPTDFRQLQQEEDVVPKPRPRSNSAESWSSKEGDHSTKRSLHGASIDRAKDEEKQRHKAVRQDSYLAAVKTISGNNNARPRRIIKRQMSCQDSDESSEEEIICSRHTLPLREVYRRPNRLYIPQNNFADDGYQVPPNSVPISTTPPDVVRRQRKTSSLSIEDERSTRRMSYLKATSSDQMNVDVEGEPTTVVQKSHKKWMYPMLPGEIQRLRRIFEEYSGILESSGGESQLRRNIIDSSRPNEKENLKILKDGWLHCKVALLDGKRAGDRSWKQIWAVLKGPFFTIQKDKQVEQSEQTVDVRSCKVDVPPDYTKRKNVLRLKTETETEYLLQAEDAGEMEQWKKFLEEQSETGSHSSPQSIQKGLKKLSNLRTRSPTGQSPASKNRKPSQQDQIPSPKSKTWKGKLGKQFRKMHQGSGSPSSPTITYPEGATIKVPIELCPPSSVSELVPLIVERCTSIVEARGLDIVGIYRVPGNTAAVTALTEAVNKGIELIDPEDPRWNDVNVISSLLKSFFRNLPDCLFTSDLYPKFIAADKIADPKFRMVTIRKLLNELPDHNYETLRHVLFHLKKVVSNSSVNKMETRNLAIVFGPTLLSTGDLMSLVTDTSHQCRIVESLISHVDWFFSTEDVNALDNLVLPMSIESQRTESPSNASLLLGNIRKVEGYHSPSKDMSPMDIVSSIISAANRKMSKGKSKKLEKTLTNCDIENKTMLKKSETKQEIEQSTSVAASIVSSFVGEMVRTNHDDLDGGVSRRLAHEEVIRCYSRLDADTWGERIRRFEEETQAMLKRDPLSMRRDAERWLAEKQLNEIKLQQARRELESDDILDSLADNPSDLSKKSNMTQLSSQSEEGNVIRRGMSFESLHETTPNGSLKRFKSSREEGSLRAASSLDSLHGKTKSETSDDGNDLVVSITKTFDEKLRSYLNDSDSSSLNDEKKSATEKAEYENVIEEESKLMQKMDRGCDERDAGSYEKDERKCDEPKEEAKVSKVKIDPKIKEKLNKFEVSETILRAKNTENASNLKRSESLTKPEKPEAYTKLRRSESLNKSEKSSDFSKLKRSDSSKNELKRSDSLTKNEKTETNINKRKQQEAGLKRSSSKEKENVMFVKLKRKNGMPDRSIKRRHTVGGTKDFDKIPWLDNRLQTAATEQEEPRAGKEKKNFRTSSPDLGSSRLQATIESEGLSIEVSLLGSRGNVLATLRKPLIPPLPAGRPQSMPPVSQLFKLPLESHV